MVRKSICIFQVLFLLSGCAGYHVRQTYVIRPTSEEDVQGFNEVAGTTNRKKLHLLQKDIYVKNVILQSDSTFYSIENPGKIRSWPFDFSAMEAVPTPEVRSVTIESNVNRRLAIYIGVLSGAVVTSFLMLSAPRTFTVDDSSRSWVTSRMFLFFSAGIIAGGGLGLLIAQSDAPWDEYRFNHDLP